ncbi:MAG: ribose-phosphate pyrophosphokinase [Alphaproteobacteria bacterium]
MIFALNASRHFGSAVAHECGLALAEHEEREFEDGEHKARPLVGVRDRDVYVIQSLHGDATQSVNDKLIRLLFFIGALKQAAAGKVTAVVPYLCYARKDQQTKPRDPVTTRHLACLMESAGTDHVLTIDVHNPVAYQNAFRCTTSLLDTRLLFARYFAELLKDDAIIVASPDVGGVKRADRFRQALSSIVGRELPLAFMEKHRSAGVVSGETVVGDVEGKTLIILDDMISTGTTMARMGRAARDRGATRIFAAATHGVFLKEANGTVGATSFDRTVVTDTVPPLRLEPEVVAKKLVVLSVAPLFARAIERLHGGGSLVELLEP